MYLYGAFHFCPPSSKNPVLMDLSIPDDWEGFSVQQN